MPRVFIMYKLENYDYSKAESFGTIVELFPAGLSKKSKLSSFSDVIIAALKKENFDPAKDFILCIGHAARLHILGLALGRMMFEDEKGQEAHIPLLVFNDFKKEYELVKV